MKKLDEIFNQYISLNISRKGKEFLGTFSTEKDSYRVKITDP